MASQQYVNSVIKRQTTGEQKTTLQKLEACLEGMVRPIVLPFLPRLPAAQSVAAAGSALGAGPIGAGSPTVTTNTPNTLGPVKITGADGTKVCTLPSTVSETGSVIIPVWNSNASNAVNVYPNSSGGTINGGSAGSPVSVAAGKTCLFVSLDNTDDWFTIPKTPS